MKQLETGMTIAMPRERTGDPSLHVYCEWVGRNGQRWTVANGDGVMHYDVPGGRAVVCSDTEASALSLMWSALNSAAETP